MTSGVEAEIPFETQVMMWALVDGTRKEVDLDYLQVFMLSEHEGKQKIVHSQEIPDFERVYILEIKPVVTAKLFVIDDETHSTMLLVSEY